MKKLFLLLLINSCLTLSIQTSAQTDSISHQSLPKEKQLSMLDISGTTVYLNSRPITLSKAKGILSAYPIILEQFEKGKSLRGSGIGMIVGGAVIMVGGVSIMINSINASANTYGNTDPSGKYFVGLGLTVIGELMVDAGIASTIVGKIKMQRAIRNYNRAINRNDHASVIDYKVGLLDNGQVGILLTF